MGRVIREAGPSGDRETAQRITDAAVTSARSRVAQSVNPQARVLPPYVRRPLSAGDPASSAGPLVDMSELAADVMSALSGAGAVALREVVLGPFTELVAPGVAVNIQTGVYAGANSPVARAGELNTTLPASGGAFKDDGRIEVHLNGQELTKGDGSGNGVAEWVSASQIKLSLKIKPKDELLVRAPFPTA